MAVDGGRAGDASSAPALVRAWDLPTRLFKWLLVACVVAAWATNRYAPDHPDWHKWNGYTVLVLIVFRIMWGFAGASTARFSNFVAGPSAVVGYAWALARGRARSFLGHNPLGGWMILALLAAVATQAMLGLYAADDDRIVIEGPLAHTVGDGLVDRAAHLHRLGFNVIYGLAIVHISANVGYDLVKRAGLIRGMVTGRKRRAAYADAPEAVGGSPLVALACLVAAVLVVFGGIAALGGRF